MLGASAPCRASNNRNPHFPWDEITGSFIGNQYFQQIICHITPCSKLLYDWVIFLEQMKCSLDSMFPGRCGYDFKCVNFKHSLGIDILCIQANITKK